MGRGSVDVGMSSFAEKTSLKPGSQGKTWIIEAKT